MLMSAETSVVLISNLTNIPIADIIPIVKADTDTITNNLYL